MNCNYCESKAQYAFAGGECMCAMCLASLPSDMVSARAEVARLRDELATVTVQRDELLEALKNLVLAAQFAPLKPAAFSAINSANAIIAKCEAQNDER